MSILSEDDLANLSPEALERLKHWQQEHDNLLQERKKVQETLGKILTNPKAKKKFAEINEDLKLGFPIPEASPFEEFANSTEKKIEKLENAQAMQAEMAKIRMTMSEYGLDMSDWQKIAQFQQDNKIQDNVAAIRLYAQQMPKEIDTSVHWQRPFDVSPMDEKELYEKTLKELRSLRE